MVTKLFYLAILSTLAVELVSSQSINCYDCDPINFASDCGDPVGNNLRTSNCVPDPNIINGTSICLSAYLNVTGGTTNMTGIYRGCRTLSPDVRDFCDWFKEERQGYNTSVISCNACNSTRCNIVAYRDDGTSGSQNVFTTSVFVLILNALLVLLLNGRK